MDKESRIEELEEALRESIRITAQREVVMAEQQMKLEHTERVVANSEFNWSIAMRSCRVFSCRVQTLLVLNGHCVINPVSC